MRRPTALLALFLLAGCGTAQRSSPPPPAVFTIPPGPGEWVIVEREIVLERLTSGRLVLPYGAGSSGRALKQDPQVQDPGAVVRYQIVFAVDPLATGDRCALHMLSFQVVHADGSITEVPAQGHVVDNSDGREGLRAELSTTIPKRLVVPAGATATTRFERAVSVEAR